MLHLQEFPSLDFELHNSFASRFLKLSLLYILYKNLACTSFHLISYGISLIVIKKIGIGVDLNAPEHSSGIQ